MNKAERKAEKARLTFEAAKARSLAYGARLKLELCRKNVDICQKRVNELPADRPRRERREARHALRMAMVEWRSAVRREREAAAEVKATLAARRAFQAWLDESY